MQTDTCRQTKRDRQTDRDRQRLTERAPNGTCQNTDTYCIKRGKKHSWCSVATENNQQAKQYIYQQSL